MSSWCFLIASDEIQNNHYSVNVYRSNFKYPKMLDIYLENAKNAYSLLDRELERQKRIDQPLIEN